LEELQGLFQPAMAVLTDPARPLREKLEHFLVTEMTFLELNPRLPLFLFGEINRNPEVIHRLVKRVGIPTVIQTMFAQSREAADKGALVIRGLLVTIYSLLAFPTIAEPLFTFMMGLQPEEWLAIRRGQLEMARKILRETLE